MSHNLRYHQLIAASCVMILMSWSQISAAQLEPALYHEPILTGNLANPDINEASGMIASRINRGAFWIHNDGGDGPYFFAVTETGRHMGTFRIAAAENVDWEDMGHFSFEGTAYLLIADVGDNNARRSNCALYAVAEPVLSPSDSENHRTLPIAMHWRFRYEDGPRDCEAVAVDVENQKILLLSKRDTQPVLYSLPLMPGTGGDIKIAKKIMSIKNIPPPTKADFQFKYGQYRSQPTAMDLSPSGREIVILTFKNAYGYKHPVGEDWKTSFSRTPMIVHLPSAENTKLRQREALCFSANGRALFVTSEDKFAPIYRLDRNYD